MRRTVGLLLATITIAACSGGSESAPPPLETEPANTPAATTEAPDPAESTEPPVSEPDETTSTEAPTTTVDEDAILAEAEAAYFEAWQVRTDVLRNPTLPENEQLLQEHYSGPNLEAAIRDLQLATDGGFISKVNEDAPAFAEIAEPGEFVETAAKNAVEIVVCEFNSDRLFEVGTAPDGEDVLVRDDPVTFLNVVRMQLDGATWKLDSGTEFEAVRDEEERCSDLV